MANQQGFFQSPYWNPIKWMMIGAIFVGLVQFALQHKKSFQLLSASHMSRFEFQKVDPQFAKYIAGFTTGFISSGSTVKIILTAPFQTPELNKYFKNNLFSFKENLEGEIRWIDAQTIEFKPSQRMENGKLYHAQFHLSKLVNVEGALKDFSFTFQIVNQSVRLEIGSLKSYTNEDNKMYGCGGNFLTADYAESKLVEQLMQTNYNNGNIKVRWEHASNGMNHHFYIDSIQRPHFGSGKLTIKWDAAPLKITNKDEKEIIILGSSIFDVVDAQVINKEEQFVEVVFSNPLPQNVNLEGLIELGNLKDFKIVTDKNIVRLFPNQPKSGDYPLSVSFSIKDFNNQPLSKNYSKTITIQDIKPTVKFVGKGVILPNGKDHLLPFEAVNLKAVDVKIVKIYENNMLQFLQESDLDGDRSIARVGKKIVQKTIGLGITNPADFKLRKRFSLDLNDLIQTEPGAMYRISLSYKKAYSTYSCGNESNNTNLEIEQLKEAKVEKDPSPGYEYDYYNNDGDDEDGGMYDYNWEERENPCNKSYYSRYERTVTKNLLSTNIGLTVKKGNDGSYLVAAADLITTQPMSGVLVEFYDYQQQLVGSSNTDGDGLAFLKTNAPAYFAVAKKDKQKAYVKLNNSNALSETMFDIDGVSVQNGLKGLLYGERGVWRPGDTLFLNFILEDKAKSLPDNLPVSLELISPQGGIYKKLLKTKFENGFYSFPVATETTIQTGNWTAKCNVGGAEFTKDVRIETVMPNRIKIEVHAGDDKIFVGTKPANASLHAQWLTGISAKNLKAKMEVSLSNTKTQFKGFENYIFDDQSRKVQTDIIPLFDGKLDEKGDATIPINIHINGTAGGMLKANFVTRVFETGGTFSVDRFSIDCAPYDAFVGIHTPKGESNSGILYTNQKHKYEIVLLDAKGAPIPGSREVKVEVYKLSWHWWWDQADNDVANFSSSDFHTPFSKETVELKNGKGDFTLQMENKHWGRYLIRVVDPVGGHTSSVVNYFDWADWMRRNGGNDQIVASLLKFTTDKEAYGLNENVEVSIPSLAGGRALLTFETGSKVIDAHWVETEKGVTHFKFKTTPEMSPNVYLHVSLIQPHNQSTNDLPIRLYGVIPIKVSDPTTHLSPTLKMPNVLVPETTVPITVGEINGKEMTFTLAMVDEGLLDLTRFKTPDPWSNFYAREGLGVKTWDIYNYVLGATGGEMERVLSIGGDKNELNTDAAKANRFVPMVRVLGPFHLKKGEQKTIQVHMPTYVGSVRTMVIAGQNGGYGMTEKTTAVKSPLMILGTLPRVLSVKDEVRLPVSVFAGEQDFKNAVVTVETNDLIGVMGQPSQTIEVKKNTEAMAYFNIKVKETAGIAKLKIKVSAEGKESVYQMELDVRNPNPFRSEQEERSIEKGQSIDIPYKGLGINGSNSGSVEISTFPNLNLESRVDYLITYPYGCIEQTTSAGFGQLYLDQIIQLPESRKTEIDANIKATLYRFGKFQTSTGSMAYWPGQTTANEWGSIYAGHFMVCAEKKGYVVNPALKRNWLNYERELANKGQSGDYTAFDRDFLQAYRLYVLALDGNPARSAMNRLKEQSGLSPQAKWLLAGAYAISGNHDVAEGIIQNAAWEIPAYHLSYITFGDGFRDEAMMLQVMCLLDKKNLSLTTLRKISKVMGSRSYLSTQSTSFGLMAVAQFMKTFGASSSELQAKVQVNQVDIPLHGNAAIQSIPLPFGKNNGGTIHIANNGNGTLFVQLNKRGKPAIGEEKQEDAGIKTVVTYMDEKGNVISPNAIKQGSNFSMLVSVSGVGVTETLHQLALSTYVPSGWEIHNARMDGTESTQHNSAFDYQDIRDDKVLTFFSLSQGETKHYKFDLNATYAGTYYLPGISLEAMYDKAYYSRKKGEWVKVY